MVPVLVLTLLTGAASGAVPEDGRVCVVVHVSVPETELDPDVIRPVFLLRRRFWPGGLPARPVNLQPTSPLRERFTRAVFGQSVQDQASYWSERYFHGTRPPPSVASEEAVLLFVSRTRGSVGYVSGERIRDLPPEVRLLGCLGPPAS